MTTIDWRVTVPLAYNGHVTKHAMMNQYMCPCTPTMMYANHIIVTSGTEMQSMNDYNRYVIMYTEEFQEHTCGIQPCKVT